MRNDFVGYQCWQPERIGVVINKEALSVDRANFLATHVPMRRIVYERSPRQVNETSESALLIELNNQAAADQHVFAVLKGIPGTGKSHLIRWLKEQYALAHPEDAVLLIARANTSLRTTIQQIVDSQLFHEHALPEALKRLQGAVDILSQETLAEKLLNGLQEITHTAWEEMRIKLETAGNSLHRRLTPEKVERFLLDHQVRDILRRTDGPIERITTFLTAGSGNAVGMERMPGFEMNDFDFDVDTLRRIRSGGAYQEVRDFCNDLHQKEEIRQSLTRYLNFALHNYAIGNATQLAAGDLRTIFNELRCYLRLQGKNLALFIEDITAFTGIDEGLIEVLVTQHRGEANADFCRLLSVIGITDSYFADRFPDNVKDRVTHQLTLNAKSGRNESDLLQDETILAEFAARYLNAMRVEQIHLATWAEHGAHADSLPNPCADCRFRQPCHAAFGAVELSEIGTNGESSQVVGLYPFNRNALATLYQFLKDSVSKTPRTFLNSLLAYILQSHGDKIEEGEFPPPVAELANDINLPTFNPVSHIRLIQSQGSDQAKRIEALLLFWGNRNAFYQKEGVQALVGGVSLDVFAAFKLKPITGTQQEQPLQTPMIETKQPIAPPTPTARPIPAGSSNRPAVAPNTSQYTERINDWANGGKLFAYDRFADWLADLTRSFIDWQAHGISVNQVDDYITGGRFVIEDQSGTVTKGRFHLFFQRSDELRFVLQALADLNDSKITLEPAHLSEHLVTLTAWIRSQEERIVAFVREPTLQLTDPDKLTRVLLQNCILLACLSEELTPEAVADPVKLYEQVITTCVRSSEDGWHAKMEQMGGMASKEWISLMRRIDVSDAVHICRAELLQLLNRPQGISRNVRYLDAAIAIETIKSFNRDGWSLTAIPELLQISIQKQSNDRIWTTALRVYEILNAEFKRVIQVSYSKISERYTEIVDNLAGDAPAVVFNASRIMLDELKQQKLYPAALDKLYERNGNSQPPPAERLDKLLKESSDLLAQQELPTQAAMISQYYTSWSTDLSAFVAWFGLLVKIINEQKQKLSEEIKTLEAQSDAELQYRQTLKQFDDLKGSLAPFLPKEVKQ